MNPIIKTAVLAVLLALAACTTKKPGHTLVFPHRVLSATVGDADVLQPRVMSDSVVLKMLGSTDRPIGVTVVTTDSVYEFVVHSDAARLRVERTRNSRSSE